MPDDLMFRPIDELAGLVRSGDLSARELVQASLDAIETHNPEINAFVDVFAEDALAEADAVGTDDERPYAGVPIAIKNNRAVAGRRQTCCADFMGDHVPGHDHNVVRRLRDAGFVIVGTTTVPEWGILPWINTRRFGATSLRSCVQSARATRSMQRSGCRASRSRRLSSGRSTTASSRSPMGIGWRSCYRPRVLKRSTTPVHSSPRISPSALRR